jgi:hypothetical protein
MTMTETTGDQGDCIYLKVDHPLANPMRLPGNGKTRERASML